MSTVFKGLTRPAFIRGLSVPLYPFLGMCIICVLLGVWIHEAMYALILPGWYAIWRVTQFDERFFDLLYLRTFVRGSSLSNSKRTARAVLTGMCYSAGSAMRHGSSSLTRLTGQSAMTPSTWRR